MNPQSGSRSSSITPFALDKAVAAALVVTLCSSSLAATVPTTPECIRLYSGVVDGVLPEIKDPALIAARQRIWDIYKQDIEEALASLPVDVSLNVRRAMSEVQWVQTPGSHGATYSKSGYGVDEVRFDPAIRGKVLSLLTNRHELEHVIDFAQRGRSASITGFRDSLHLRTLPERVERRAFQAQYRLARKIADVVDPALLRRLIVEESGLPRAYHRDFEDLLGAVDIDANGKLTVPQEKLDRFALAGKFRNEINLGIDAMLDNRRAAELKLREYLRVNLDNPGYQRLIDEAAPDKKWLLITYAVLAVASSSGAFIVFAVSRETELKEAGIPNPLERPKLAPKSGRGAPSG